MLLHENEVMEQLTHFKHTTLSFLPAVFLFGSLAYVAKDSIKHLGSVDENFCMRAK